MYHNVQYELYYVVCLKLSTTLQLLNFVLFSKPVGGRIVSSLWRGP